MRYHGFIITGYFEVFTIHRTCLVVAAQRSNFCCLAVAFKQVQLAGRLNTIFVAFCSQLAGYLLSSVCITTEAEWLAGLYKKDHPRHRVACESPDAEATHRRSGLAFFASPSSPGMPANQTNSSSSLQLTSIEIQLADQTNSSSRVEFTSIEIQLAVQMNNSSGAERHAQLGKAQPWRRRCRRSA